MSPLRDSLVGSVGAAVPRGEYLRLRFRASLDMVLTLAIAILAIVLIVAYQVLSRISPKRFEGPG